MKAKWSVALLGGILIALLPLLAASAASLSSPAVDGDGTMAVVPANVTYGISTTVVFTYTATGDIISTPLNGNGIQLSIPPGWPAPTAGAGQGHVSIVGSTGCSLNGWGAGTTARDIYVDITSCLTGKSFTINYTATAPSVSGSPFAFLAQTDLSGGTMTPLTAGSPSVTVDPKVVTVLGGLTANSKLYDGTTAAVLVVGSPTLSGVLTGDSVTLDTGVASAAFADRNAGTGKSVLVSGLALAGPQAGDYAVTQPTLLANINKRPITITAVTDSKVYDGTTASVGVPSITSGIVQPGDTEPAWRQRFDTRNVGIGKALTPVGKILDGNAGNNYAYTYATATGTVSKYPITVTAAAATKVYDRTTASSGHPAITSGVIQPGDAAPAWAQTYNNATVGSAKALTPAGLVNDGNGGSNYSYTYTKVFTGVITPRPLTVSATGLTPNSKIYDGTTAATGVTGAPSLLGVVSGDSVTLVTTGVTYTFANRNAGTGKLVYVTGLTLTGLQAIDYTLVQPNRTATISRRPITVTAVTDHRVYDGTRLSSGLPTRTSGAIQSGDLEPVWTQTFNNKNVGTGKILKPAGVVVDGNGGNNYQYTFINNRTGAITPLALTVTAISDTKTYDGTTHAADLPSYSPALVGSDTPGFTEYFDNKNVGTGHTLTPTGVVNDGNNGNNYTYQMVPGATGVINVLPITVTAVTDSKTYDGTIASSAAPSITPPLVGTDTSGFTQSFDTKDVGTGKTLTPSGIVNDGNGGANYSVTLVAGTAGAITAKPITVTANPQSKALGALDPALTYRVNPPLLAGDAFAGALARVPGETYGLYAITQGTLSAGSNYGITYVSANLLIGPAISGNAGVANAVLSYTDGVSKSVTADGSGNYSLVVTSGWTGTVTPRKAGYAFKPVNKQYPLAVTSDVTGQNFTAYPLVTVSLPSAGTLDGWVLESSQTSNIGGTLDTSSALLNLGDDAANRQYRAILSFNTSLPPTAVITAVTLKFKPAGKVGTNPFTITGNYLLADIQKGAFSNNSALQITDFQAVAAKNAVLAYTNTLASGWYSKSLLPANFVYINRSGVTQFRLHFTYGDNNNKIADYLTFYSGNAAAANRPLLVITYYVP